MYVNPNTCSRAGKIMARWDGDGNFAGLESAVLVWIGGVQGK
jgi:hypothetical protein